MGNGLHRYLVKFTIEGAKGSFWTDVRIWDVHTKTLRGVLETAIHQAKEDAGKKLQKKLSDDDVNIVSFSLIDYE